MHERSSSYERSPQENQGRGISGRGTGAAQTTGVRNGELLESWDLGYARRNGKKWEKAAPTLKEESCLTHLCTLDAWRMISSDVTAASSSTLNPRLAINMENANPNFRETSSVCFCVCV